MKFGKEFASQMVHEWQDAYMDYNSLKKILKGVLWVKQQKTVSPMAETTRGALKRKLSLYRAFSGLTSRYRSSAKQAEDDVILVSAVNENGAEEEEEEGEEHYHTMFLKSTDVGGDSELLFFRRLDDEFNKVLKFYRKKVEEVLTEAEDLSKQMDALIALRIKVEHPVLRGSKVVSIAADGGAAHPTNVRNSGQLRMDVMPEVELSSEENSMEGERQSNENKNLFEGKQRLYVIPEAELSSEGTSERAERQGDAEKEKNSNINGFRLASLDVLNHVKINIEPQTPVSTIKSILPLSNLGSSFSKVELKKAEQLMAQAFIEFHRKLRLLKRYCFLNQLAFSKIMKKYDKITSRNASKAYMQMVDDSYLGSTDVVNKLIERVEATFVKHFANGNHRKGMQSLRPNPKREKHRITFFMGLFFGGFIALAASIGVIVHAREILESPGRDQYMENIFPLYSLFMLTVLHMLVYAGNIFFWKFYRVNYSFIFGFKQGTELSYREVLLLSSGLGVLTLAGVLSNLNMEMDPETASFGAITELVPLGLLFFVLFIIFCPFNIMYRSSRLFLIQCLFHSIFAPFYKVILPDFFLADQLTSQVQTFRNLEFYVCYYGWGDFTRRSNSCQQSEVFKTFYYIMAIVPYWIRFLQCLRRLFEEKDYMHGLNGLKYVSTIVAVASRTTFESNKGLNWKIVAAATSGVATIANTYWDIVIDWGLLRRDSRNPWLRDKLVISNRSVYFVAMVLNVLLRLAWMQSVLGITELPFMHNKALVATVASLEIIRRGIWNFFRLENEHLNNVGKFRAFKSVPLPFNYDDEDKSL